jgi:peptidyl-prolyl cis-trans isomerase C
MKNTHSLFAAFALFGCISSALAQNVAVVNGKPVAKARQDQWIKQMGQPDTPELRDRVKGQLIEREILQQEAVKRGIADRPEVKFQLDVVRQTTLIQALLRDELQRSPITEETLKGEYDKQRKVAGDKEYHVRHILVDQEADAKDIIERLKKGEKFEELAKKSKDPSGANGGDLDWAAPGGYVKPFADAMIKLEKGKFTETPVKTQFGWHVIRLDDIRDTQIPPFEQVKPQIQEMVQQQRVQAFIEGLKGQAKVQ